MKPRARFAPPQPLKITIPDGPTARQLRADDPIPRMCDTIESKASGTNHDIAALKRAAAASELDADPCYRIALGTVYSNLLCIAALRKNITHMLETRRYVPDPDGTCRRADSTLQCSAEWLTHAYKEADRVAAQFPAAKNAVKNAAAKNAAADAVEGAADDTADSAAKKR